MGQLVVIDTMGFKPCAVNSTMPAVNTIAIHHAVTRSFTALDIQNLRILIVIRCGIKTPGFLLFFSRVGTLILLCLIDCCVTLICSLNRYYAWVLGHYFVLLFRTVDSVPVSCANRLDRSLKNVLTTICFENRCTYYFALKSPRPNKNF